MSEAISTRSWLSQVELAFDALKGIDDIAAREEWFEVIREDEGSEAETELKARLAAYNEAKQAKAEAKPATPPEEVVKKASVEVKPKRYPRRDLSHLNGAKAAPAPKAVEETL